MSSSVVKSELLRWLLDGKPWAIYRTLTDLLDQDESQADVAAARQAVSKHKLIQVILDRQHRRGYWGRPKDIHTWWPRKDTSFWILGVLADFGLTLENPHMARAAEYILALQLPLGGFQGFEPEKAAECHTAILLEPLVKIGLHRDTRMHKAYQWLLSRQRLDGGWWCKDTGQIGGPREKEPSCPFATMFVLSAMVQRPDLRKHSATQRAVDFLLSCWKNRGKRKYPGHDSQINPGWEKLKYPFTDYRILKFLDVLSRFPKARKDEKAKEILDLLMGKADERGRFHPESIVKVWADFDFGQKKEPSRWITLLAWRIMERFRMQD
jgi:hypothetical protein